MLNKKMLLSLLVIGVVSVTAGAGTWAVFTDEEVTSDNTFTAGTVELSLGTVVIEAGADGMKPGDTKTLTIPLSNLGSLDFDYVADVTTDSATATSLFAVQGIVPGNTPATATITSGATGMLVASTGTGDVVVTIELPATAGNEYQGDSGLVTVTITATQTA